MLPDTLKTRGVHTSLRFAPPAVLDKQHKLAFQSKCSEGFDWRREDYGQRLWQLSSPQVDGDPRSQLKLSVGPEHISFEDFFPTGPLDVYYDNVKLALDAVAGVFEPKIIVATGVAVRFSAQAQGGDARVFLGNRGLHLDSRLGPLGRPVHAVGLKMLLPPVPGDGKPHWQADVKVESLVEDISQIYIEVDARWPQPAAWNLDVLTQRIAEAHTFATTNVVAFLQNLGAGD